MDNSVPSFSLGAGTTDTAARGRTPGKSKSRSAKPINHAAHAPPGSGISAAGQQDQPQHAKGGSWQSSGAFVELDANQQPMFARSRFAAEGKAARSGLPRNVSAPGQVSAPAGQPTAVDSMKTWAAMLNSIQNQKYDSPGAAAFRNHRPKQDSFPAATAQQPNATAGAGNFAGFASHAAQQASPGAQGNWFAATSVPAGRDSPAASLPPGSAMSTDTAMPTAKPTAAPFSNQPFSVMSVDMAATPVFSFGSSGGQQPGQRGAQV